LLQPAQLAFAAVQHGTGSDQTDKAAHHESHAGPPNPIDRLWGRGRTIEDAKIEGLCFSQIDAPHDYTSKKNASGGAEPNLRSLHAKLHFLERVIMDCQAQLLRADPNQDATDDHPNAASDRQSQTGSTKPSAPVVVHEPVLSLAVAFHSEHQERHTGNGQGSRRDESERRSPFAKLQLF